MSKLFKLKEWLTLPDAARHLTGVFGEIVTEADVLRLGIDGRLTLSVNIVNGTRAIQGNIISEDDAEVKILPRNLMDPLPAELHEFRTTCGQLENDSKRLAAEVVASIKNRSLRYVITDLQIDDNRFLRLEEKVSIIRDVWDLPLIGSEKLDIENCFYQEIGGPEVTGINLEGTFVKRGDVYASLQEPLKSPTMSEYTKGFEDAFYAAIAKAGKTRPPPREPKPRDHPDNFFPAGGLPEGSVLVVRTSALTDLQSMMMENAKSRPKKESSLQIGNLIVLVGLMMRYGFKKDCVHPSNLAKRLEGEADQRGLKLGWETIFKRINEGLDETKT